MAFNASVQCALRPQSAVIVQPEAGRGPWLAVLEGARQRLWLVAYRLTDTPTVEALIRAHERGLDVRVLLHSDRSNESAHRRLGEAGVRTAWGNSHFPLTHQKCLLADATAWVMTFNLWPQAFTENRGFGVAVTDSRAVAEIGAVFEADWERRPARTGHRELVWTPGRARTEIVELVGRARGSLEVVNEHLDDYAIEDALIAAVRRGVKVRVLMTSLDPGRDRNARGRRKLADGGVEVRLLREPYQHAKVLLVDGLTALVGSINFSRSSLEKNRELSAYARQPQAVQAMRDAFERDWSKAGR